MKGWGNFWIAPAMIFASGAVAKECGTAAHLVWSAPANAGIVVEGWPLSNDDTPQWGGSTAVIIAGETGPEIEARFPKGSINPGNSAAPEGGAGFLDRFNGDGYEEGCLTYEIRFEPSFDFGEGGKLPGLFGGSKNSGCTRETTRGFSSRYMWGRRGVGFLYPYFADRTTPCGGVMGSGRFFFEPGRWTRVSQRIRLNAPIRADGEVDIWFDGEPVFSARGLRIRADASVRIEGLMFASFFGGSDPSRASPANQSVRMRGFTFRVPP